MSSTALQLVRMATAEIGIAQPSLLAGVTALDTIQQLALLNAAGIELQSEFDWQALCKEYRFTTQFLTATGTTTANSAVVTGLSATTGLDSTYMVVGTGINTDTYVATLDSPTQVTLSQVASASGTVTLTFCKTKYAFPSDFNRQIDRTNWDKSRHWMLQGPESPQQWQWLKSGYISTGPRIRFRRMGGTLQIWPAVSTAEYLGFEYVSTAWVTDAGGVAKSSFTVDTDTCVFPDRLMVLGLKKKFTEAKGFAGIYDGDFQRQLDIAKANDAGSEILSMAPRQSSVLIDFNNIPDSGYGV